MLNGKPASWIAEESNRAVKTIRTQIDSIKGKLQVSRKGEIIAEVTRHGLQWIASDLDIDNS
ncbi:MAG: response regulator transcription factor [Chromatiales bacterium]|nr:response regulator transcription factor [Chromatiales bacterium]